MVVWGRGKKFVFVLGYEGCLHLVTNFGWDQSFVSLHSLQISEIVRDQRPDHSCGLRWSWEFLVLGSLGPVQSWSFSSLGTGLPSTNIVAGTTLHATIDIDYNYLLTSKRHRHYTQKRAGGEVNVIDVILTPQLCMIMDSLGIAQSVAKVHPHLAKSLHCMQGISVNVVYVMHCRFAYQGWANDHGCAYCPWRLAFNRQCWLHSGAYLGGDWEQDLHPLAFESSWGVERRGGWGEVEHWMLNFQL